MNGYAFDRNGIYTGRVQAQAGPVTGSFIYPAGTTPEAPPGDEPGKWIWAGLVWREVNAADRLAIAQSRAAQIISERLERQTAQTETFTATEFAVLAQAGLFDEWTAGETYAAGKRFVHLGRVYEVQQEVLALENQPPDGAGMLAVYRPVSLDPESGGEAAGTIDDPIPFLTGMDVARDKYYSFGGLVYLAKADMPACVWPPDTQGLWQWEAV